MLRWIVGTSLRFRFLIVAGAAALMVFGVGQLKEMPIDVFPEFAPPRVEIQTAALGLSPAEVEALVTVPLEEALQGLPSLDAVRSKSVEQLSSIELIFNPGTDLLHARQVVGERLASVTPTLPTWSAPPFMMQPLSATSRIMKIGMSSVDHSLIDMSLLAYWKMRARLLRVPGVANVTIWGERVSQLHVEVDPGKLGAEKVSLQRVMEVTAEALDAGILQFSDGHVIGGGGFVDTPNQRIGVRHILPILTPDQLAKIPIASRDGRTLRLADIANLTEGHQPLIGDAVINDGPGLMLIVEKLPWGNTLEVSRGVEAAIEEMKPGLPGIEIDTTIFRPATFVEHAVENLGRSLLLGVLLMVIVLGAFLYDWRSALISAVTIPLSLTAAGLVLWARGATINTMVLAGFVIALGAVVDDAIVDVENIVRRLRIHRAAGGDRSLPTTARVIYHASLEVRGAVVYASIIEALALLPVFFLTGLTGSFFRPLAMSYALAVVISTIVALVSTPALSLLLLRKADLEKRESPVVRWVHGVYERALAPIVRSPRPAYAAVGGLVALGLGVTPFLGQDLLPSFKERDFLMHWVTAPGTSLPEEMRVTVAASKELRDIPGVRNFGAHIGQAFLADEVVAVDFGENWVSVDPKADYDKTLAAIQSVVDGYPGIRRDVQTYLKERIREVLTGAGEAIVIRIAGPDLDELQRIGKEIETLIGEVPGVVEEHVELQKRIPQIAVTVDLDAAGRVGLKPGDVRRAAAIYMASEEVGDILKDGKAYDVHLYSTPETRTDLTAVRALLMDTPSGGQVRLDDVADVSLRSTPNSIHREGVTRVIDVEANVKGRDLGSVVAGIEQKLRGYEFPQEYHAEILGEFAERQEAQSRLFGWAIVAAIGIVALLVTSFASMRLAILTFLTMPIAMVGGILAARMSSGIISLGSLVGFFTVLGIVARNGIMMISHFRHLEIQEGVPFGPGLVLRGARERVAPILMTALTTGLALVPLLITGNIPGQEIEYPMAIVILGGLVASTSLNLFVVPSLYLRFARTEKLRARTAG